MTIRGWNARHRASQVLPDPHLLTDAQLEVEVRALLDAERRAAYRWLCDRPACDGLPHAGMRHRHARAAQRPPLGRWLVWAIIAGRGFGKTRTGAETAKEWGIDRPQHVAVIGENLVKVKDLCFEHPKSGLLAVIPPELVKSYHRGVGMTVLTLRNGTVYRGMSAEQPDRPRGYAFDKAWYDEFGAWGKSAGEVHSNVMFALREADDPRIAITTTPKPVPHVRSLIKAGQSGKGRVTLTRGHMRDNVANLSADMVAELEDVYAGTRLGQQELAGVLLDDVEGALWALAMFEWGGFRLPSDFLPDLAQVVVAVDPAAKSKDDSDQTGIVVAGRGFDLDRTHLDRRPRGYVMHAEQVRERPEQVMRRVADLYHLHKADAVVVEVNNGGDWIPTVLQMVDPSVNVRTVDATRGKVTRAEPVSGLYEQQRVHHVGPHTAFAALEDQLTTWTENDGDSPDLLDALVWALTDLLLGQTAVTNTRTYDRRLRGRR